MTVYAITDTKKGRTWIALTYLHTTRIYQQTPMMWCDVGTVSKIVRRSQARPD